MRLKVYISDACGNARMRHQQNYIMRILEIKGIPYLSVDVADPQMVQERLFMQTKLKINEHDIKALPPQIFFGEEHRGAFEDFFSAVECEELFSYLRMNIPESEVEFERKHGAAGGIMKSAEVPTVSVQPPSGEQPEVIGGEAPRIGEWKQREPTMTEKGGNAITAEGSSEESSEGEDSSDEGVNSETESITAEEKTPEEREEQPVEKGGDQVKAEEDETSSSDESSSDTSSSGEEETDEETKDMKRPAEKGGNQVKAEQHDSSSEEESSSSDDSSSSDSSSAEEE